MMIKLSANYNLKGKMTNEKEAEKNMGRYYGMVTIQA